ncbi:T9SS type A sorting domain-containing protein [bacterium]|nr:T9SS type A sorting domain-containing protein [bacterium]
MKPLTLSKYMLLLLLTLSAQVGSANPFLHRNEIHSNHLDTKDIQTDDPWDLAFYSDVTATTGDDMVLGAEFAQYSFYIAGSNSGGDPNYVYVLNSEGDLMYQFTQWSADGYGWRDLVYDGAYLFGADDDTLSAFDLNGNPVPAMDIIAPLNLARGLAYDPATDHFWTAGFGTPLYEFDREGNVIWSGVSGLTGIYGLAWDEFSADGPWLWMFDQSGNPSTTFYKFDPILHLPTGESYTLPVLPGTSDQVAAGAFITEEYDPDIVAIGGIAQGVYCDLLFILELIDNTAINLELTLDYQSGSPVPIGGGVLVFDIHIENLSTFAVNFDAWLATQYEGGEPTTMVLRSFDDFQPGWAINRNGMYFPVPAAWAGGNYTFWGRTGIHPAVIYVEDSFMFIKEGSSDDNFRPSIVDEINNPFEEICRKEFVSIASKFELSGAHPNPFNPTTTISYVLSTAGTVELSVFDISGREVAKLVDGYRDEGVHEVQFDATGLASGVYLYRLNANGNVAVNKMILMK